VKNIKKKILNIFIFKKSGRLLIFLGVEYLIQAGGGDGFNNIQIFYLF